MNKKYTLIFILILLLGVSTLFVTDYLENKNIAKNILKSALGYYEIGDTRNFNYSLIRSIDYSKICGVKVNGSDLIDKCTSYTLKKINFTHQYNINSISKIEVVFTYNFMSTFYKCIFFVLSSLLIAYYYFKHKADEFVKVANLKKELQDKEELVALAKKVAHDIRSPLSALNIIKSKVLSKDSIEEKLFSNAVNSIHEIAIDLLNDSKKSSADIVDLRDVVSTFVKLKAEEYRNMENVRIQFEVKPNSNCNFSVKIQKIDFLRLLSNIVNNSVDAKLDDRRITIKLTLSFNNKYIQLAIEDNGKGISQEILSYLGEVKISYGKKNNGSGFGLGLSNAKKFLEQYNGTIEFTSQLGNGTKVLLTLQPFVL